MQNSNSMTLQANGELLDDVAGWYSNITSICTLLDSGAGAHKGTAFCPNAWHAKHVTMGKYVAEGGNVANSKHVVMGKHVAKGGHVSKPKHVAEGMHGQRADTWVSPTTW